jgi:hypothetical protein
MSETVTRRDHAERVRDYYREQGATAEQQRIIKLIEDAQNQTVHVIDKEAFESKTIKIICETIRADFLIALIKGQTNA